TKLTNISELGEYFTFTPSKNKPIYNWFFYKEAFSPEIVEYFFKKFEITNSFVVDPFCGVGTTLLCSKSHNISSYGCDASPLAVFVSKVKTEEYTKEDIDELSALSKKIGQTPLQNELKWTPELFNPSKIFPNSSLNFILRARENISYIENSKHKNFFLLALLSIIPQCSLLIKDGGVLKFDKRKSAFPAKIAFKRKIKKMISNLSKNSITGSVPKIELGDARNLSVPDNSADSIITSPPYLNNIDYTKIYGLELSLLSLDEHSVHSARAGSLQSFHSSKQEVEKIPKEVEEFGIKYPLIGAYFSDMEKVFLESYRVLKKGSSAAFIVGNSIMYETHILTDEILAEIAERIGFETEIITSLKRYASVKTKIETRESAVVLKKN
ncbi:MAG: hypothetical protein PHU63_03670, partial [Candidatus ainarchaeum sp.]|nr:hypothetical protein [Candidatus ainarchaeum sp.]